MKKKSIIIICAVALAALIVAVAGKDMWFGGFHFGPPEVGTLPSEASWVKVDATINEDSYSPGEDIVIELTFQNNSTDVFTIEPFPPKIMVMPSLKYGLVIHEFLEGEEVKPLESGETVSYILTWDQLDKNGQQVPAGDYRLALGNIDAWNQRFRLTLDKPAEITITSAPDPMLVQPPSLSSEDAVVEMSSVGTMSGLIKHLTISANGSIVYIEEEGPRIVLPGSYRNRTTKTGQLTEAELNSLLEMVNACPFDTEGKFQADTDTIDTDVRSMLYVHYQGTTREIIADYDPLYSKVTELPDVPETVKMLYHKLWYVVENRTTEVAREKITAGG
jgi:hypothetical protein